MLKEAEGEELDMRDCHKCSRKHTDDSLKWFCEKCYQAICITNNNQFKRQVKTALPAECTHCRITDKDLLTMDHIDPKGERYNVDNIQWLCFNCHRLKNVGRINPNRFGFTDANGGKV